MGRVDSGRTDETPRRMDTVGHVFLGVITVGVLLGLALFISALPDIARYSRIRKM